MAKRAAAPTTSDTTKIAALRRRFDEAQAGYTREKLAGNEHEARWYCGQMSAFASLLDEWFNESFS